MFPVPFSRLARLALAAAVLFVFPSGLFAKTSNGQETVSQETAFYYTVKKGDTLWDISRKFFDTPWQWPALWEKNEQLPNPHWIYPGERLKLYLKNGVVQVEKVKKTPKTAPSPPFYEYPRMKEVGFIRKTPITPRGVLFQSKSGKDMISTDDLVYLHPKNGGKLRVGQQYLVYRIRAPLGDFSSFRTVGYQHYFVGIVQIIDHRPALSVARVIDTFRTIQVGDLVVPYHPISDKIILRKAKVGMKGHLLIAEDHRQLIGEQMVCFINKGARDGIEAGQAYQLYYRDAAQQKHEVMPAVAYGSILVLKVEPTTASVLVTHSNREIAPGATFRTEKPSPGNAI